MSGIEALQKSFEEYFNHRHFPVRPKSLYDPLEEFLSNSGKLITVDLWQALDLL